MRPHVELIQQGDLCWHDAELPKGDSQGVKQRNLSYDEEDGSASMRVVFEKAWKRPGGYHEADTEWYVEQGLIRIGDRILGKGGYWRAPAGLAPTGERLRQAETETSRPSLTAREAPTYSRRRAVRHDRGSAKSTRPSGLEAGHLARTRGKAALQVAEEPVGSGGCAGYRFAWGERARQ